MKKRRLHDTGPEDEQGSGNDELINEDREVRLRKEGREKGGRKKGCVSNFRKLSLAVTLIGQ